MLCCILAELIVHELKTKLNLEVIIRPARRYKRTRDNNRADNLSRHHRKPRRLGGTDDSSNISWVPRGRHEAFHLLFDSFPVETVTEWLNLFLDLFGTRGTVSNEQERRGDYWMGEKKSRLKKKNAWFVFIEERELEEIVDDMNANWIDPDYQIGIQKVKRVMAKKI